MNPSRPQSCGNRTGAFRGGHSRFLRPFATGSSKPPATATRTGRLHSVSPMWFPCSARGTKMTVQSHLSAMPHQFGQMHRARQVIRRSKNDSVIFLLDMPCLTTTTLNWLYSPPIIAKSTQNARIAPFPIRPIILLHSELATHDHAARHRKIECQPACQGFNLVIRYGVDARLRRCGRRENFPSGARSHESFHVQDVGQSRPRPLLRFRAFHREPRLPQGRLRSLPDLKGPLQGRLCQALLRQGRKNRVALCGRLRQAVLQAIVRLLTYGFFGKPCEAQ